MRPGGDRLSAEHTRYTTEGTQADSPGPREQSQDLYRREALESLSQSEQRKGELLRISPAWTRWTYWVLLGFALAAVLFLLLGTVSEYAEGPAVVRVEGRNELTAMTGGTVSSVEVASGEEVVPGQALVRFYDASESAELDRIRGAFELQLVNYLKNPNDAGVRQDLIALRTQKGFAEARLEQLIVRAPHAGLVGDIQVRPGQVVSAGDAILSLLSANQTVSLIAMLPGSYRPQLRLGMPLRLELAGYRYAFETTTIESIGDQVIGPQAARRYLGQEIADTLPLSGAVVVVQAKLPSASFFSDKQVYAFHDGMHGRAEVRVRSERLLLALVPGLKAIFEPSHG
jgi:multidrug efflux pump subunit AcrA (membrane-fusion protein)